MSPELPPELSFDRFTLHSTRREVWRDGSALRLGSRAFEVLLALAERRDRVVGKNELMSLVWPGLYVQENNLQVHVSTLRKLLGPRVITTIPGRGYRFTAGPSGGHDPLVVSHPGALHPALNEEEGIDGPPGPWPGHGSEFVEQTLEFSLPPDPRASLLGRRGDLAELLLALRRHRMVTVIGAGGVGKTSLALAAAYAQEAGEGSAAWVEVAPIFDGALVPGAIAAAMRAPLPPGGDGVQALVQSLSASKALLVIDNAEHLVQPLASLVQALLTGCPGMRLMVTSQTPLRLDAEHLFRLGPLAVPRSGAMAARTARLHGATALFERQVQALDRNFCLTDDNAGTVADICRRLDGIALAIKLAAARLPLLGLQGLCDRLDARLMLLGGGNRFAPARQKTLRAALEWSHSLLSLQEQTVFRRLSVCVGGFTLDLAAGVAADHQLDKLAVIESIAQLVDRSLIALDDGPRPRYRMLESARAYALQALEQAGERGANDARHARAVLAMMRESHDAYIPMPEPAWMDAYLPELENLRAALEWAVRHDGEVAVALLGAAARFYQIVGLFHEALPHTERVLEHLSAQTPPAVAWGFWALRANSLLPVSRDAADDCYERYVEAARASGDSAALFIALSAGIGFGNLSAARGQAQLEEMRLLLRADWPVYLHTCMWLAEAVQAHHAGELPRARALLERMAVGNRAVGKLRFASHGLTILAGWDVEAGQFETAVHHAREAVAMQRQFGGWNLVLGLRSLVQSQLLSAAWADAVPAMRELAELTRRLGWRGVQFAADGWALHAARAGRLEQAARFIGFADARFAQAGISRDRLQTRGRELAQELVMRGCAPDQLLALSAQGSSMAVDAASRLMLSGLTAGAAASLTAG